METIGGGDGEEVRYSVKPPSIPGSSREDPGVKRLGVCQGHL